MWHTGPVPSNPMAFASVLYPGRCLASQPIHSGSEEEEGPWFQQGRILTLPTLPAWWECIGRYFTQAPSGGGSRRVRCAHGLWSSDSSHSWLASASASGVAARRRCRHRTRRRRRRRHRRRCHRRRRRCRLLCRQASAVREGRHLSCCLGAWSLEPHDGLEGFLRSPLTIFRLL